MTRLRRLLEPVNWKYAFGELVLIIAGVLIALAANAWWAGRQDEVRVQRYLRQLHTDFAAMDLALTQARNEEAQITDASWRLFRAMHSSTPYPSDTIAAWFSWIGSTTPVRPSTGTLLALIESGDVNGIRNDSLRSRLIGFVGRIDQDLSSLRQIETEILSIEAESLTVIDLREYGAQFRASGPATEAMPRRPFPADWQGMMHSSAFNALVTKSWTASVRRWGILQGLLADVRGVLRLLAHEVGEPAPAPFCQAQGAPAHTQDQYTGTYESQLSPVTIAARNDSLYVSGVAIGGSLLLNGEDVFCGSGAEALLRFGRDSAGSVDHLTIEQWGRTWSGARIR